ncbi:hypothetical protein FQZ97_1175610 [compost metagenome]
MVFDVQSTSFSFVHDKANNTVTTAIIFLMINCLINLIQRPDYCKKGWKGIKKSIPCTGVIRPGVGGSFQGAVGVDQDTVHAADGTALLIHDVSLFAKFGQGLFRKSPFFKHRAVRKPLMMKTVGIY